MLIIYVLQITKITLEQQSVYKKVMLTYKVLNFNFHKLKQRIPIRLRSTSFHTHIALYLSRP